MDGDKLVDEVLDRYVKMLTPYMEKIGDGASLTINIKNISTEPKVEMIENMSIMTGSRELNHALTDSTIKLALALREHCQRRGDNLSDFVFKVECKNGKVDQSIERPQFDKERLEEILTRVKPFLLTQLEDPAFVIQCLSAMEQTEDIEWAINHLNK